MEIVVAVAAVFVLVLVWLCQKDSRNFRRDCLDLAAFERRGRTDVKAEPYAVLAEADRGALFTTTTTKTTGKKGDTTIPPDPEGDGTVPESVAAQVEAERLSRTYEGRLE